MRLASFIILFAVAVLGAPARADLPPLVEPDLLPAVDEPPTCACVGEGDAGEGDFLVIGYASGYLMAFQRVAGRSAMPSPVALPGRGPVASVAGVRFPGGAGAGMNHAILAAQGRTVSAVSFERGKVMGSCQLPPPVGVYRLDALGVACALAYDDDSAWVLSLGGTSEGWSIRAERVLSATEGLRVTASRDGSVTVLADGQIHSVTHSGAHALGQLPPGGLDTAGPLVCTERLAAGRVPGDPRALRLLARSAGGAWASGVVPLPGPLTMLAAVSDSTVLAGGVTADTTGWVEIVDRRGVVLATGAHAVPPVHACVMDGCYVVHGADGNLSVLGSDLESLWDEASRFITPVALLALDYDGDGFDDAALVGERLVVSRRAETDSLRRFLKKPDIMAGARLVTRGGVERYEREETHAEVLLSRRALLERLSGERERSAIDALDAGEVETAIPLLAEGRAASAAVGDRERVARLTRTLADWTSRGRRTLSTGVLAVVLALAGALYAAGCGRRLMSVGVTGLLAVALLAVGGLGWRLFGSLAWTPLLAVGGLLPLGSATWRLAGLRSGIAPDPTAPVDDLREAVAQLRHAVDDDLRAVGRTVTDAPRKNVTAIAALAEDLRRSLDDPEQYAALVDRLRVRSETFRSVVAPHLEHVAWIARRARFVTDDAGRMRAAGARMAAALDTVLAAGAIHRTLLEAALKAMPDARRELVAAVERAWNEIEANPGCSVVSVFEHVAREKWEEMKDLGVEIERRFEVKPGRDAVRMRPGELYFAMENLFTNALRAMKGARIRTISAELRSDGVACTLRFSDTGDGMTPERAAEIMKEHPSGEGGGAGIPGTLRIARRYGGDFHIERTEVGAGTTFVLTIPHWSPGTGGQN